MAAAISERSVERRLQMAWKAFGCNENRVEPAIQIGMVGMRHQPGLRSGGDALLLARGHGPCRVVDRSARLHLNEHQNIALPRHHIDLAMRRAKPPRQNAIALGKQKNAARLSAESPV